MAELSREALTKAGLTFMRQGKVRDVYELDDKHLVLVATDRISAFDYRLQPTIPGKGALLTEVSRFWFDRTESIVPNHVLSTDVARFPASLRPFEDQLEGRSMLVKKLDMPFSTASRVAWSLTPEGGEIGVLKYVAHPTDRRKKLLTVNPGAFEKTFPKAVHRAMIDYYGESVLGLRRVLQ